MESVTFDDLEAINQQSSHKPLFAVDLKSDDDVLRWLNGTLEILQRDRMQYLERAKNNYLRYKGYQYFTDLHYSRDILGQYKKYTPQIVLPLISDAIDDSTSRMLEMKPAVVTIPTHNETRDKVDSKIAKRFLQHIDNEQKLDRKFQKLLRNSEIVGESFLWVRWNPDLGEPLEDTRKRKKTEDGVSVVESLFQGDVEVKNKTANWLFYEKADSWEDVNYCFIIELDYTEAGRLEYPKFKDSIVDDAEAKYWDYETMEKIQAAGKYRKITFYHKKTKFLPDGYEAVFTPRCLLKKGPISYKHGKLPIVRMVDVENDEELAGQAQMDKTRAVASAANNLLNSVVKMFMLAGYAKWFVEAGAVDDQSLNNDVNIVKIKQGAKAPVLAQANPVGTQHFNFIGQLKTWFYEFMKSNSIVRGEPPPGVSSGVALQYVSESESRRMRTKVTNFNAVVRETNYFILATASQFYLPEDERTYSVLGKDNRWEMYPLDISALAKSYNVMIQNTSGLSDSKAVRTQQVIDLAGAFPEQLPREQILEMTGLAQNDRFYDVGSAAVRAAEDENEWMMDGKGQIEPQPYEDLIAHWRVHLQDMQSLGFKQKATPEIVAIVEEHVMATEMLMMEMMEKNPTFAQRVLAECPQFPVFMEMPISAIAPVEAGVDSTEPIPQSSIDGQIMTPEQEMAEMNSIVDPMVEPMTPETPDLGAPIF